MKRSKRKITSIKIRKALKRNENKAYKFLFKVDLFETIQQVNKRRVIRVKALRKAAQIKSTLNGIIYYPKKKWMEGL